MNLELKDSQYIKSEQVESGYNTSLYCLAVDSLNSAIKNNKIEFFSLGGDSKSLETEFIWYQIDSIIDKRNSYSVVNKATFFTSHYIGYYSTKIDNKTISIHIKPRFGDEIFNYLISYAYGIYLPKGTSSSNNNKSNSLWLIAMMWKATLDKAMTKSQIPKEYQKVEKNLSTFKGQLNISKHIKDNLFDKSKFYCNYRQLTMNTTINQTIRYIYKLLEQKGFGALLRDIAEYDQMLHSFGVESKIVDISQIQNIRYSKLNIYYKKVMELSSLILKSESKSSDEISSSNDSFSYFLDISELWENYLLKVLQKNLPEYNIYSPNERGGEHLLEDNYRQIRPDIIIEENGEIIAILDAKYKWYNRLGRTAKEGASRDDLYQMCTYLYHYADKDKKVLGLFITPVEGEEIKSLKHNINHKIGILGLNIKQFNKNENIIFSTKAIHDEELSFIDKIKKELSQ